MNPLRRQTEDEIERALTGGPVPPPPPDLLDRIHRDIPANLPAPTAGEALRLSTRRSPLRRWLPLAATLAVAVGGAYVGVRLVAERDVAPVELRRPGATLLPEAPPRAGEGMLQETAAALQESPVGEAVPAPAKAARELAPRDEKRTVSESASLADAEKKDASLGASVTLAAAAPQPVRQKGEAQQLAPSIPSAPSDTVARSRTNEVDALRAQVQATPVARMAEEGRVVTGAGAVAGLERQAADVAYGIPEAAPAAAPKRIAAPPSTGGTAEPNDQPVGDMFFRATGVNPFVDTGDDRFSTFGLDVDTGSYTLTRSYLEGGHLPPPEAIRVEEFVNAFTYPERVEPRRDFTVHAEGAPSPFARGERLRLVRFHVQARPIAESARRPVDLIFVVDVSGSMARENRLGLVRQALGLLLGQLREDDRVGLVVYGTRGRVLLAPTGDHDAVRRAVGQLVPEGSTNAEDGLRLAYDLAAESARRGAAQRLILCSDGVANVGATGPESILSRIGAAARRGVELSTFGFGMGNYNDALLEQLADQGNGRYAYVDDLAEAERLFVAQAAGTVPTVARDAKAQVEWNPRTVERYRLLGYENRDVADERFRDDRVDAGEIGAGHAVTALYEVKLREGAAGRSDGGRLATLRLRYREGEGGAVREHAYDLGREAMAARWEEASRHLRVAAVAAELAERLKGSYWTKDTPAATLLAEARSLVRGRWEAESNGEVAELARLVERAVALAAASGEEPEPFERPASPDPRRLDPRDEGEGRRGGAGGPAR